tara:strand:+ start:231979 stop:232209 length:231 start_codon:yes stop_codon:yes gene_type:complete
LYAISSIKTTNGILNQTVKKVMYYFTFLAVFLFPAIGDFLLKSFHWINFLKKAGNKGFLLGFSSFIDGKTNRFWYI